MSDGYPRSGEFIAASPTPARAESESEFAALVDRHRPYLKRLAQRVLSPEIRRKEDPSDIVQLTVIEAQAGQAACQAITAAGFRNWLGRILLRNVLDAHRRYLDTKRRDVGRETSIDDSRSKLSEFQSFLVDHDTPSRRVRIEESAQLVRSALVELKPEYQNAIVLHYDEGLTYAEIARILGKSPGAAEQLVKRAVYKFGIVLRKRSVTYE